MLPARRQFLQRSCQLGVAAALLGAVPLRASSLLQASSLRQVSSLRQNCLLSARTDAAGQHYCVGYTRDGAAVFRTPVLQRCHDVAAHPFLPRVAFVARRPGTAVYLLDSRDGRIVHTLPSRIDRHFYGHGLFDAAGEYLYLVENDTRAPGRGVMGVYRLQDDRFVFEREFSTHGVEPHQFAWLPDHSGFAIANGGVRTEANSREAMDDVVESSLTVVNLDGSLRSRDTLADARASIRHVAVAADGTLVTGQQYVFENGNTPDDGYEPLHGGSLIAIKRPQQSLQLFPLAAAQMQGVNYYSASITVHNGLRWLAASAPRGHRLQIWHLDSADNLLDWHLPDCAGIAAVSDGFIATSGQQSCFHARTTTTGIAVERLSLPAGGWDNHLVYSPA